MRDTMMKTRRSPSDRSAAEAGQGVSASARRTPARWGIRPLSRMAAAAALAVSLAGPAPAFAQQTDPTAPPLAPSTGDKDMMLTVFMRHDQSKNLTAINDTVHRQGFFDRFPPAGVEIMSWYIVMGIGQVLTIKFPPERLREINLILENTLWGGYRTEYYATYDFKGLQPQWRAMMQARPKTP